MNSNINFEQFLRLHPQLSPMEAAKEFLWRLKQQEQQLRLFD